MRGYYQLKEVKLDPVSNPFHSEDLNRTSPNFVPRISNSFNPENFMLNQGSFPRQHFSPSLLLSV